MGVEEDEVEEPELISDFQACAASRSASFTSPPAFSEVVGDVGADGGGSGSVVNDLAAGVFLVPSSLGDGVPGALFAFGLAFALGLPASPPSVFVGHAFDTWPSAPQV